MAVRHVDVFGADVTREAKEPGLGSLQQVLVHASVRGVANRASFHLHGGMFMGKGSTLFNVTGNAGLIRAGLFQHQTLGNTVVVGQCKLGLNRAVARNAKFRLRFFQQAFVEPTSFFHELRRRNKVRLWQRGLSGLSRHPFAGDEV